MIEIDLKAFLEKRYQCLAFPLKITQGTPYPAITYAETSNRRNSQSSLNGRNLVDQTFTITFVAKEDYWVFENKDDLITYMDGFAGTMGDTKLFICRVGAVATLYDEAQQIYEYHVDVKFTIHK